MGHVRSKGRHNKVYNVYDLYCLNGPRTTGDKHVPFPKLSTKSKQRKHYSADVTGML